MNFRNLDFTIPELRNRSIGAVDFMKKLIHQDPDQRYPAQVILYQPWISKLARYTIDKSEVKEALDRFRRFRSVEII